MNRITRRFFHLAIGACLCTCLCFGGQAALGEAAVSLPPEVVCLLYQGENTAQVHAQIVEDEAYLFLPSCADLSALRLSLAGSGLWVGSEAGNAYVPKGGTLDLTALFPGGPDQKGIYLLNIAIEKGAESQPLHVMHSANIASLFVISDDPVNEGRSYVDGAFLEEKRVVTGSAVMLNGCGIAVYDSALRELRGRGNSTWIPEKAPYQIKLENKCDLLETGNKFNRQRTWVLLAERFDPSFLHNTIALALGNELGLKETPEFRPVDLYYDGEYRGLYTLCEKPQAKSGRVDIMDTQGYLEQLYPSLGDMTQYQQVSTTTSDGLERQFTKDLDIALGLQAAYLLELDTLFYGMAESWFEAVDWMVFEVRNPTQISEADLEYVAGLMVELITTVENGGVHPETNRRLSDYLDLDSAARFMIVQQFVKNFDFGHTSTYFYLPELERKFYAGPLWDFDLGYGNIRDRINAYGTDGCIALDRWVGELLSIPEFQQKVQEVFDNDFAPLVTNVLLAPGEARSGLLRSISSYIAQRERSAAMDHRLHDASNAGRPTMTEACEPLSNYLSARYEWLTRDVTRWSISELKEIALSVTYYCSRVTDSAAITPALSHRGLITVEDVQWNVEPIEGSGDADYTAVVELKAAEDVCFLNGITVTANNVPVTVLSADADTVTLQLHFHAPIYEEAMYNDVDYGLLYRYDYFIAQHPEVIEECGGDPDDVLAYYVDYCLSEGINAIETFDFELYYYKYQTVFDADFGGDVTTCTLFYLDNVLEEELKGLGDVIYPRVIETD